MKPKTPASPPASADGLEIRPAGPADAPVVLSLVRALADYERLSDAIVATEDSIRVSLFGPSPSAEAILAFAGGEPVGFAVYFHSYSTFVGRRGLYLEDLFVKPGFRGQGYGRRLLSHLARLAVDRGCGRFEWAVLDWNEPAIGFYQKLGARPMSDWTVFRLDGEPLAKLAAEAPDR